MENKIRVAHILGSVGEGGVEKMIMNLYEHIDRSQISFDFYVENTSIIIDKNRIEALGGNVIIIPPCRKLISFSRVLKENFKKYNYDIVHASMNTLSVFPLRIAKKSGISVRISHSHSTSNKKEKIRHIIKNLLRPFSKIYATNYIACSDLAGKWLFGNSLFKKGKIDIIDNAIDLSSFSFNKQIRQNMRKSLNLKDTDKLIGHIGRFCSQKNQEFLINIFSFLQKRQNYYLLFIGTGSDLDKCKSLVKQKGLKNVYFFGPISNVSDYYNAMDCFVLPSLYEGLPVVGVEAQANNLKCFFSNDVTKEAKLLNDTVFIDLNKGAEYWAKQIDFFLDSNSLRVESHIDKKYDINNAALKLLNLYKKYLKNI